MFFFVKSCNDHDISSQQYNIDEDIIIDEAISLAFAWTSYLSS